MSEIRINGKPLYSLRVVDLKDELEKRGLSKSGKKDELLQRLESFLEVNPEEDVTTAKEDEGEPLDVIEASRIEAEQRRLAEEKRQVERKKQEEEKRKEEEERKRKEAEEKRKKEELEQKKREVEESQRKAEEERQKQELEEKRRQEEEEQRRKELEEKQKREDEEKRRKEEQNRKREEEEKRKREDEEKRKEEEKRVKEKLKQKELEEERRKEAELEQKRKEEEEEKKRREDAKKRKEEEERLRKEEEKRLRKEEEERKAKEEEEKRRKERDLEEKRKEKEAAKIENESKEQRLKEELLKRLCEQKEKEEAGKKKEAGKGEEEEEGDLTLVMEIDQNDLVTEDVNKEKKDSDKENNDGEAVPGQVKSLRRLGGARAGQESEKKKRGWGASRTSRLSSSDNIEITSNSLKDIVPDMKPLLSKDVVLEEEEGETNNIPKNGHHSDDDDEIGPILPADKETEKAPVPRKKIKMDDSTEESDVILVMNLTRPFTITQLKQMLQRTGTIEDFWIDKIKSRCCVKFANVGQASETRMALNGVTWPSDNKNPLHVVFSNTDNLERLKKQVEQPTRIVTSNGVGGGTRDWDREKLSRDGDRRDRDRRAGGRERSEEISLPKQPTKSLEDLFKKTKQLPALYWKPLSEETIQKKEEARNRRVLAALKNKKSKSRSRS